MTIANTCLLDVDDSIAVLGILVILESPAVRFRCMRDVARILSRLMERIALNNLENVLRKHQAPY